MSGSERSAPLQELQVFRPAIFVKSDSNISVSSSALSVNRASQDLCMCHMLGSPLCVSVCSESDLFHHGVKSRNIARVFMHGDSDFLHRACRGIQCALELRFRKLFPRSEEGRASSLWRCVNQSFLLQCDVVRTSLQLLWQLPQVCVLQVYLLPRTRLYSALVVNTGQCPLLRQSSPAKATLTSKPVLDLTNKDLKSNLEYRLRSVRCYSSGSGRDEGTLRLSSGEDASQGLSGNGGWVSAVRPLGVDN